MDFNDISTISKNRCQNYCTKQYLLISYLYICDIYALLSLCLPLVNYGSNLVLDYKEVYSILLKQLLFYRSKPKLPRMVIRRVLFEPVNKHLILACPKGGEKSKALIRWRNNTIVLNPLTIRRKTRGRVFMDSINRLHIRRLRKSDSAPYNCWKSTTLIATIKVIVTDANNDTKVKEIITYTGLCLTIFSIFLICVCTFCKKKKKTAK